LFGVKEEIATPFVRGGLPVFAVIVNPVDVIVALPGLPPCNQVTILPVAVISEKPTTPLLPLGPGAGLVLVPIDHPGPIVHPGPIDVGATICYILVIVYLAENKKAPYGA
jgi:hypothetical protein